MAPDPLLPATARLLHRRAATLPATGRIPSLVTGPIEHAIV